MILQIQVTACFNMCFCQFAVLYVCMSCKQCYIKYRWIYCKFLVVKSEFTYQSGIFGLPIFRLPKYRSKFDILVFLIVYLRLSNTYPTRDSFWYVSLKAFTMNLMFVISISSAVLQNKECQRQDYRFFSIYRYRFF